MEMNKQNHQSGLMGGDAPPHVIDKLLPYQKEAVEFLVSKRKALLFDDMG